MADRCEPPEKWRDCDWHWLSRKNHPVVALRGPSGEWYWWYSSADDEENGGISAEAAFANGWRYLGPALPPAELMRRLREPEAVERLEAALIADPATAAINNCLTIAMIHGAGLPNEFTEPNQPSKRWIKAVLDAIEQELGA